MSTLAGGVFPSAPDDLTELRNLVDDIGSRSFDARIGTRSLPDPFDATAWGHLEDAGLTRLTSIAESGGGPAELAVVLRGLARHAVSVPVAENDVLAGWLAGEAGLEVPDSGAVSIATTLDAVPYATDAAAVVLAIPAGDRLRVAVRTPAELSISRGHNAGGEPRDAVLADLPEDSWTAVNAGAELLRRGAWARCVQVIGALDAAVEYSVAHTQEREQFGRPLSSFQVVQHTLASMAGEVERARAVTNLAVAAAADHGFDSAATDYAVTVAKVTLGRVVPSVVTAAHQLHGAIGVTVEHRLWLATMRARSWIGEFGDTAWHACRLGRLALDSDPWDVIAGERQ